MSSLVDPHLVKIRAGRRGSGWAIGTRGVLTARHVVERFLEGAVDYCVAVPGCAPVGARGFDCEAVWQDPDRDLALLGVDEKFKMEWARAVGADRSQVLTEPGIDEVSGKAVGYPDAVVEQGNPQAELAPGRLLPAGGEGSGHMPFDVDSSVPDSSKLWMGMSGAAFRDDLGRVLGVVVGVAERRQQRRLYVARLPDPTADRGFAAALEEVGAAAVLEAPDAPRARELLSVLDPAGRPYAVAAVPHLGHFGVRRARTDIDTHGDPYYPYAPRNKDSYLQAALSRRLDGTDRRVLVVAGGAMTGKSRTLAEALRHHAGLRSWRLLKPHRQTDLREIARFAGADSGIVWLDDLTAHAAAALDSVLLTNPGLIIVGTLRTDQLRRLQDQSDPMWDILTNERSIERIDLEARWTDNERDGLNEAEQAIREAVSEGRPLGEVLGAADELRKRLGLGSPRERAMVYTVADLSRTGLFGSVDEAYVRRLWPIYSDLEDTGDSQALADLADDDRAQEYRAARSWTCQSVAGSARLLSRTRYGLAADGYIIGLRADQGWSMPPEAWYAALDETATGVHQADTLVIFGLRARDAGFPEIAEQVWEPIASAHIPETGPTAFGLGKLRAEKKDFAGARIAYQQAIASQHHDAAPAAATDLGYMLAASNDDSGAIAAFELAASSNHPQIAPQAALNLGILLASHEDVEGAQAAFQQVIDSDHQDYAPQAAAALGTLLVKQGDVEGARTAYQLAIDSGHPDDAPKAAFNLGALLGKQQDVDGARAAYQMAIDSNHPQAAPRAAVNLGVLLYRHGETNSAQVAFQAAIDGGNPDFVPEAAVYLGTVLSEQGDTEGAQAAYQLAIDSGHPDYAPQAAMSLGDLLDKHGDAEGAKAARQQALDSGWLQLAFRSGWIHPVEADKQAADADKDRAKREDDRGGLEDG